MFSGPVRATRAPFGTDPWSQLFAQEAAPFTGFPWAQCFGGVPCAAPTHSSHNQRRGARCVPHHPRHDACGSHPVDASDASADDSDACSTGSGASSEEEQQHARQVHKQRLAAKAQLRRQQQQQQQRQQAAGGGGHSRTIPVVVGRSARHHQQQQQQQQPQAQQPKQQPTQQHPKQQPQQQPKQARPAPKPTREDAAATAIQAAWRGWRLSRHAGALRRLAAARRQLSAVRHQFDRFCAENGGRALTHKQFLECQELATRVLLAVDEVSVGGAPELRAVRKGVTAAALALCDEIQAAKRVGA